MNNRDLIIEMAMKEFSKYGYEKASLNNILKKSNLSKGTFYHYFKSKEELYMEIMSLLADMKYGILDDLFKDKDILEKMDFFDALEYLIDRSLEFMFQNPLMFSFSINFLKEKGNSIYDKVFEKFNPSREDMMEKYFDYFYNKTNFRKDISKESIYKYYQLLLGGIIGIIDIENLKEKTDEIRKTFEDIFKIAKNGMIEKGYT